MPSDAPLHTPAEQPSCAFVQFSELFLFPAHTVGHLNLCDALTTLGVDTTLYMLPPADGVKPVDGALASAYGLANEPRIEWVRPDTNKWVARLRVLRESAQAGRHVTFTYSTRGLPTLGALLGGAPIAVHEIHQPTAFWSRHDRWAFWLAKHSHRLRIVCISQHLAAIIARESGVREDAILVEHSGHNFPLRDDYHARPPDEARLRVLYAGSFDPGKGLETLFALAELHPEMDFVAVGGEPPPTGLADNVTVMPRVAHSRIPELLSEADILLMPFTTYLGGGLPAGTGPRAEEFYSPLKMVEYLSAGRAIVSANLPSIAEVLVDGSNCLLVEADSLPAWSAAVGRLREDPALRERLAHGAALTAGHHTVLERARRILAGIGVLT